MEKFGPQLYESDKESDNDKKADNEKKSKGDGTKKPVKSLPFLPLQSEKEEVSRKDRSVEMKLAFIAGKYTELPGGKSEKHRKSTEAKETSEKNDELTGFVEDGTEIKVERAAAGERQVAGEPDTTKTAEAENLLKTSSNAEEAKETDDESETYRPPVERKLARNQVGGEFVLTSDKLDKEHVVLLHDTRVSENVPEVHAAADVPEEEPEHHSADTEAPIAEPEPPTPGSGEVPPIKPPEDTNEAFDEPEEPEPERPLFQPRILPTLDRPEPAQVYREYMQREAAARQTETEQMVTKAKMDDEVYAASKYYQRKGLLTGLIVGGAYEHFKHKRREKKAAKRAKEQNKRLEAARKDYSFGLQEQERQRAELNARLNVAERRVTVAEQRTIEQQNKSPEAMARPANSPEQPTAPGEQLVVPTTHRIELSTWLSTEVDKRTGRAVERPTFQYGHEYYRERAQEAMPIHQRNAAAGGVALKAAANGQAPTDGTGMLPVNVPNATMQGSPSQVRQQANDAQRKSSEPIASATLLWPWVLALVLIVICLAIALR